MRVRRLVPALLTIAVCGPHATRLIAADGAEPGRSGSLIGNLQAEDVEVRRDAAAKIRASDKGVQRDALPAMIDVLVKEKDGQVRLAVLDAVTALGRDAESAIPALIHTLRTDYGGLAKEELHQDYRSALALAAVGKPAVEGLRGLLNERKENVRAEVVMGLGRIGPDAAAAVPDLVPLLGDKSERIRREASLALGRIGEAASDALIAACSHQDILTRAGAVESLGHLSEAKDRALQAVFACTHDPAPEVRAAAVQALGRLAPPVDDLSPVLKESLRHEDERVRLAAVNLLVERRALLPQLATEFEALLTAEHDGVSRHASYLLRQIGPDAAPALLRALRLDDSRIDQIAEALAGIGRPIVGPLTEALGSPEPRVRRGAALALGQIRPLAPGVVQHLTAGLDDADLEVRAAFLAAIGHLGPRAAESAPKVRALLRDESAEVRLLAITVLSRSAAPDDRLVADLVALLDDADQRVQGRAIESIRSLGPPGRKALDVVIGKLNSPHPEVRLAAAEFIGSHAHAAAEAVPTLGLLLNDPTPALRTTVAQTLGKIGKAAQPALERLTSRLDDDQVAVRAAVASTLGSLELDAEAIRPPLAKALRDDDPEVRRAAMNAIQRLGPSGTIFIPDLIQMAEKKENLGSVQRVLRRFERRGPDARSVPEFVKQLEHEQEAVRLLAMKFLGLAGPGAKDAIPALERLRNDPSTEVRNQADAAIERIKNQSASARRQGPVTEAGPK